MSTEINAVAIPEPDVKNHDVNQGDIEILIGVDKT